MMSIADTPSAMSFAATLERREFLVAAVIATASALVPQIARSNDAAIGTAADWQNVLQAMFPHPMLGANFYGVPAGALIASADKDPATRELLAHGWRRLSGEAGGDWSGANAASKHAALTGIVGTPLFGLLRQTTVFTLYANPDVWKAFGYDGDAWHIGGYAGDALVTVDWLPDPPVNSGPPVKTGGTK